MQMVELLLLASLQALTMQFLRIGVVDGKLPGLQLKIPLGDRLK